MQRFALGGHDLANGAQWRAKAAVGEGLVELRHFQWREFEGAKQRRGIGRRAAFDAEPHQLVENPVDPKIDTKARGRDIIGIGQHNAQRHLAMELAVVVLRFPIGRAALAPYQRAVVQRRQQRVAVLVFECGEKHDRLGERADRPLCVDGAVVAGEAGFAPAHQRQHLAVLGAGHHHRPFQGFGRGLARLFDLREARGQRLFGVALGARIESREDTQALAAQIVLVVIAPQLPVHKLQEGRIRRGAGRRPVHDPERFLAGFDKLRLGDEVKARHLL